MCYTLIERKGRNMKNILENTAVKILENVENPLWWLAVMVTAGDLTESEAGYLIVEYGIK
jgi:hypothetical protein